MENQGSEILSLKSGTVVHVCGWPVELKQDTDVQGHPGNIELIRRDLYLKPRSGLARSVDAVATSPQASEG